MAAIAVGLIGAWIFKPDWTSDDDLLKAVEEALLQKDYPQAEQLCQRLLYRNPDSRQVLTLAATAAEKDGRLELALRYLDSIPDDESPQAAETSFRRGELAIGLGHLTLAESSFRRVAAIDATHVQALKKLCFLLRIEGRNYEAQRFLLQLAQLGQLGFDDLFLLGTTEWVWLDPRESQFLDYCQKAFPKDGIAGLGRIRQAMLREEFHPAMERLKSLSASNADIAEAQARMGTALVQESRDSEFIAWNENLPDSVEEHPGIWFARGLWLKKQGEIRPAIRCFGEAVLRNPNHRGACYQLSQLLGSEKHSEQANAFALRAKRLASIEELLREVQQTHAVMRELTETLLDLGRDLEAETWLKFAAVKLSEQPWMTIARDRLSATNDIDAPVQIRFARPFYHIDWSEYPLPEWGHYEVTKPSPVLSDPGREESRISFVDVASKVGFAFQYNNGSGLATGRAFMFEFSGGGVAAIDYDGDGWPDIYLTQGGGPPSLSSGKKDSDKLFRNLGQEKFLDVSRSAGLENRRFGQGVTVGDYDNDGFPDLYVTNIGANLFFRNLGDGTFENVTNDTGTAGNEWSLSASLADLNGDSFSDLYVVNYLGGPGVFVRSCQSNHRPVQCPPGGFPAEQDRLYLNLGNGQFREITDESGIRVSDGKGMGIVVGDFEQSGRPQILIANDTTANFLFVNDASSESRIPEFVDRAALRGVAFNDLGNARSSMGIASGDANEDGLLDLLITNYIREGNSFLVQQADHSFVDQTRDAGLRDPSLNKMGWGTQFLDVDSDGLLDLAVANGHLDDYSTSGVPYKMSTQIFRNRGKARFQELPSNGLGSYFAKPVLGRALARIDWNRDGREDICVTHVDVPFSLLSNTTKFGGNSLVLSLRGVIGSRDAIGAIVQVQVGDRVLVRQLTSGDGFEASNEHKLIVGLGHAQKADAVTIRWPSGNRQVFSNLTSELEWIVIEGQSEPVGQSRASFSPQ